MKKKKTIGIGRFVFNIPVALILIIIAMMVLVPVVWVTLSAFKTEKEIISWPPTFIPKTFTLENFVDVQGRIDAGDDSAYGELGDIQRAVDFFDNRGI
jgi:multiple sugar transport system permease protein